MSRDTVTRALVHALGEMMNTDEMALPSARKWLDEASRELDREMAKDNLAWAARHRERVFRLAKTPREG